MGLCLCIQIYHKRLGFSAAACVDHLPLAHLPSSLSTIPPLFFIGNAVEACRWGHNWILVHVGSGKWNISLYCHQLLVKITWIVAVVHH
mmetsp:Transcript_30938/g.51492  ORF Transcript_30938/g.51492 Transcript_30938/m.51492 type:complete len:89 (+) Transcript_30938:599-865(+)